MSTRVVAESGSETPDPGDPNQAAGAERRLYGAQDQVTLLLGEPDAELAAHIATVCQDGFLQVRACPTARELLYLAGRLRPGLLVVRASMPDAEASDVVAAIRPYDDVPVVVSVGKGEVDLAGPALLAGATELTDHPYRDDVFRDLVRRHLHALEAQKLLAARIQVGDLVLDGPAYAAWVNDRVLPLTTREFELLQLMMNRVNRVVSYEDIRDTVWGSRGENVTRQTVAVHMSRLRDHLAEAAELVSVRGVGYRLSA